MERKGTLTLRCNHMNYSSAVLNQNWHHNREAEPKDYDISTSPYRNLGLSSYKSFGTSSPDEAVNGTTYQSFCELIERGEYSDEPAAISKTKELERDGGRRLNDGVVLPIVGPDNDPEHFRSIYEVDYNSRHGNKYRTAEEAVAPVQTTDYSDSYKKCLSQFVDTTGHRRSGRNTWQDESGVYANSHLKANCPTYGKTYTLLPGGRKPN